MSYIHTYIYIYEGESVSVCTQKSFALQSFRSEEHSTDVNVTAFHCRSTVMSSVTPKSSVPGNLIPTVVLMDRHMAINVPSVRQWRKYRLPKPFFLWDSLGRSTYTKHRYWRNKLQGNELKANVSKATIKLHNDLILLFFLVVLGCEFQASHLPRQALYYLGLFKLLENKILLCN
jgi:hypothetical protein